MTVIRINNDYVGEKENVELMDSLEIKGGVSLRGDIQISGAKNAALPVLAAGLMAIDRLTLGNVPRLADTLSMENLLSYLGVAVVRDGEHVTMSGGATNFNAPYELVSKMRASGVGVRATIGTIWRGASIASGGLCHWHPSGRFAHSAQCRHLVPW
jgi:UDP-N-acetylglucosamine enolpyruvyl transferase